MYVIIQTIMKRAITIDKDQRLSSVVKYFDKNRISRAPVLENKKLVGMITERDIIEKIGSPSGGLKASSYYVSSCMTHNPISVMPTHDVSHAIDIFTREHFSGLPVINKEIHIITKTDILAHLEVDGVVAEVMKRNVFTLRKEDRVIHARRIFLEEDPPLIPIVEEDICGIITKRDVLFGLYKFRDLVDKHQESIVRNYTVEKIMSQQPMTTTPNTPLSEVKKILVQNDFNALPVINYDEKITGFVGKDEMMQKIRII
jgi:CBS domain-containing protein